MHLEFCSIFLLHSITNLRFCNSANKKKISSPPPPPPHDENENENGDHGVDHHHCFPYSYSSSSSSSSYTPFQFFPGATPPLHGKPIPVCGALPLPPRNPSKKVEASKNDLSFSMDVKNFSFSDLKGATKNFRSESLIGEGGFGCVFKGWIDPNTFAPAKPGSGIVVAIKRLRSGSYQGHKEWLAEVNYLGQLRHENLVKLIGYCLECEHKLLVYEYMPRGSLENHLFRKSIQPIPWATRMNIAIGVARGLAFLHSLDANVIYRDLKASNILLDLDFNAKLSDFGLARDGPTGDKTHVSTRVMGTRGYAAPEYLATGHLTSKSDVYSFGVVLLELISGKRVVNDDGSDGSLVDWAKPFLSDQRRVLRIMDTRLGGQYPKKEAHTAAAVVLQCLQVDPKNRPNMADVLASLEDAVASKDGCRMRAKVEPQTANGNLEQPVTPVRSR